MESRKLNKKHYERSAGSLLVPGTVPRAVPENIIDQSVYQKDKALYIPQEDWKY
ncbi:MAG: hypothetical protein PHG19_09620 [Anaerotignum sp.]|nr:hypothetical protein [Anaerotignum sp.]